MKGQVRIDAVFAFVMVDPRDDTEGIPAVMIGEMAMPLFGADMARINSLRDIALQNAERLGVKVQLIKFSQREVLEEFIPKTPVNHQELREML